MKRGKPLERKTALKRTAFKRKPRPEPEEPRLRFVAHADGYPPDVVDAIMRRSNGRCEIGKPGCTEYWALGFHHRLPRSPVRVDTVENLLLSCTACHDWLHGHRPQAIECGLTIPRGEEPPTEVWTRARL